MSDFVIISNYPSPGDNEKALKDSHGRYLWHLLFKAGAPKHDIKIEFLWQSMFQVGGPSRLVDIISRNKPKVILALGSDVMRAFDIEGRLNANRGSVYKKGKSWVVPTFHPSELKSPYKMFAEEPTAKGYYTLADIKKAVSIYRNDWVVPDERFIIEPNVQDVRDFHDLVKSSSPLLGADLEADGLSIEHSKITMHGFAWTESDAICIPVMYEKYRPYWNPEEWVEVRAILDDIYSTGNVMFQNGVGYDVPLLRQQEYKLELDAFVMDTMVMHHVMDPESPHNIGFISSIYGKTSYWKNAFITYSAIETREEILQVMKYNCRDCTALIQIEGGMRQEMGEMLRDPVYKELPHILDKEMECARISVDMYEKGILLDKKKLHDWRKYIDAESVTAEGNLRDIADLPPSFNLKSSDHKKMWVYGEVPASLNQEKIEAELKYYNAEAHNYQYECTECGKKITKKFYEFEEVPNERSQKCPACKCPRTITRTDKERTSVKGLSKESTKYLDLSTKLSLSEIEPLYKLHKYEPLKTKADSSALDKKAVVRYQIAIDARIAQIDQMKRRLGKHDEEKIKLLSTRKALTLLANYGKISKLKDSFYTFPAWRDGYVRPNALVTGTATGRWSYKKPNSQQIPAKGKHAKVRQVFRADPGCVLLSGDWSNLEVNIGARLMNDEVLIAQLEAGLNIHDENTKTFFKFMIGDASFATHRDVAKIIQFARLFYGGSDRGIYTQVKTAVPECTLTFKEFCDAVNRYFVDHPAYPIFVEKVQKLAIDKRISVNAYGRVRALYGERNKLERQALNSPIQGSAADFMSETMILIYQALKDYKTKMVLQVHDEIIFNALKVELPIVYPIIKSIMEREVTLNGHTFSVPTDFELGTHWGAQGPFNETTFKVEGDSKH